MHFHVSWWQGTHNGTLANGNKGQNLRSPGGLIVAPIRIWRPRLLFEARQVKHGVQLGIHRSRTPVTKSNAQHNVNETWRATCPKHFQSAQKGTLPPNNMEPDRGPGPSKRKKGVSRTPRSGSTWGKGPCSGSQKSPFSSPRLARESARYLKVLLHLAARLLQVLRPERTRIRADPSLGRKPAG